ncbi:MAG TPA: S-methyl-5'-thioinosine phosphorylase [Pseudohongiella sp.]|nr:5'-methylthioadenosine phosphorylase [Pseudohongiella sp.]HBX35951.1 S-methyl-5'-thioinosine phosphorylase [Pseudohongiella sp.]|tara:strand:- start:1356 stop:2123 length:768 start_codon:yes stop_codon:yes gene_type:complete
MLAVIGGSGLNSLTGLQELRREQVTTPYQQAPVSVSVASLENGRELVFLPRHGDGHVLPPHRINYRANIFALHQLNVSGVIAVNAVGGISEKMAPGVIVLPDQIIDYTWGRDHTFFDGDQTGLQSPDQFTSTVAHIDFTRPYDDDLQTLILHAAGKLRLSAIAGGVYGATQGPRLETPAEIRRLAQDGCDLVGMTGMPEAALAREIGLPYVCLALSVNWAAGITDEVITMDSIRQVLSEGMDRIQQIVLAVAAEN